jgi:K+ transport systems, NAD-binding component
VPRQLLAAGEHVLALGRDPRRLAELAAAGADVRGGDAADAAFLADAFRGADAVHTLQPYDPTALDHRAEQDRLGEPSSRPSGTPGCATSSP